MTLLFQKLTLPNNNVLKAISWYVRKKWQLYIDTSSRQLISKDEQLHFLGKFGVYISG